MHLINSPGGLVRKILFFSWTHIKYQQFIFTLFFSLSLHFSDFLFMIHCMAGLLSDKLSSTTQLTIPTARYLHDASDIFFAFYFITFSSHCFFFSTFFFLLLSCRWCVTLFILRPTSSDALLLQTTYNEKCYWI